jgi:DnaD/phage-associated family protein
MNDQLNFGKDSIYREGYGIVAKLVMRNRELSPEAKAIYSYICSFAGSGTTAFPSAELMMHELNMGDKRFYKFRKELVDKGYITIIKQRNGNRRDKNIYQLETEPSKVLQHRQFESVQSESVQPESVQNEGSNNNSNNINSFNNNNSIKLLSLYEELGFGLINPTTKTDLEILSEEYTETWVMESLKEANESGVRNLKYVRGILKNWKTRGFKAEKGGKKNGATGKPTKNTESEGPQYNFDALYGK